MSIRGFLTATGLTAVLLLLPMTVPDAVSATSAPTAAVEPRALNALSKMGVYLRALPAFEVVCDTVREEVDINDQKLQFLGSTVYKAKRDPDGLVVDVAEDRRVRHFVYDGKTATMFAPRYGYYAKIDAPPTIRGLLDLLDSKYGVVFPLEDLFLWGTDADRHSSLKRGYLVGSARISGRDADHYAFRENGIDWQIWIARGDNPLPLRIAVAGTADPKLPQMEANLKWNTAPKFAADTFAFKAPAGAKPIGIVTISH